MTTQSKPQSRQFFDEVLRFFRRHLAFLRAAGFLGFYTAWVLGFKLITLTVITYFLRSSNSKFQEISDVFGSNELLFVSLSALLFVLFLRLLNPLTSTTFEEIITPHRLEKRFAPGFLHGLILASGVAFAFLLSGLYRYLGMLIQLEEASLAIGNILLRIFALGVLAYCEEFIFRYKIMGFLRKELPDTYAVILASTAYCGIKMLQFDLGLMQIFSLFLLATCLGVRTVVDGDFSRGAGFLAGLLIVFHPLFSLPIFGNEFPGVMLIKYQATLDHTTSRFLTGGVGGPLSSFALQFLLLVDLLQSLIRNKKILLNRGFYKIK